MNSFVVLLVLALPPFVQMSRVRGAAAGNMDTDSGIVYVALKLQSCKGGAPGDLSITSKPFPLSLTSSGQTGGSGGIGEARVTHVGAAPEIVGRFSEALPCPDGKCSTRGSLVQPFYDEELVSLFDCSDVECASEEGCHVPGDAMRHLTMQLNAESKSIESFRWDFQMEHSAELSTNLLPMQDRQDPFILQAYRAVWLGMEALKDAARADVEAFVAEVHNAVSTEVVRTREVIAEWIYDQLSLATHTGDTKKELTHWLLAYHGPDAYGLAAQNKYQPPQLCKGTPADNSHKVLCVAISKALESRKMEKIAASPFFKRDVKTKGLLQGHSCGTVPKASRAAKGMRILVVGAGPVGLLTAIYEQLSISQCNYEGTVEVIEKYHDLATRTNVVHLTSTSFKMLESIGALSVMPPHQRLLLEGSDKSISISQLQRALWRVARLSGIRVRRGVEFLAYCPPVADENWFAVTKKHESHSELDHNRRSNWAAGSPPDDTDWRPEWLQRLCDRTRASASEHEFIEFDAIVAADGPSSLVRDQARHFSANPIFGETLSPAIITYKPTNNAYGVTINYKPAHDVAWNAKAIMRQQCETAATGAGDRHGYTFMSEHWCYHALLLFESNETDAKLLSDGLSRNVERQVEFASQFVPKSRLLYNARHLPDISVFKVGFQYVRQNAAAHVMTSRKQKPMLLLIVGDAFVPGFFPLANGVNKGFERIKKLNSVGGIAKLSISGLSENKFKTWVSGYNQALQATSKGSEQAKRGLSEFSDREKNRKNKGGR